MKIKIKSKKSLKDQAAAIVKDYLNYGAPMEIIGDEDDFHINTFDALLTPEQIDEIESKIEKIYKKYDRVMSFETGSDN